MLADGAVAAAFNVGRRGFGYYTLPRAPPMTLLGAAARAPACFPPPAPGMQSSQRPLAARDTNPKPARRRRLTQRRGGVCCLGRCRPRSTRNGLGRRAGQRSRARRTEGGGCVRPVKDPTAAQTAALRGGGSGRGCQRICRWVASVRAAIHPALPAGCSDPVTSPSRRSQIMRIWEGDSHQRRATSM